MSSKNNQKIDMKSIKEYEKAQRSIVKTEELKSEKINFDQWWADKCSSLKLAPHMKEILRADFKGRGLGAQSTQEQWNWAAKQFGLTLEG